MDNGRIRVRRRDRQILKRLGRTEYIREVTGVDDPTYEDVLEVVLPEADDDTVLERPEEDMVFVNLEQMHQRTRKLAGENVPAHEVIRHYVAEFVEEHDIEFNDGN